MEGGFCSTQIPLEKFAEKTKIWKQIELKTKNEIKLLTLTENNNFQKFIIPEKEKLRSVTLNFCSKNEIYNKKI